MSIKQYIIVLVFLLVSVVVRPQKQIIKNTTNKTYIDNVISSGLDSLGIGNVRIVVRPLRESGLYTLENRWGSELRGLITGNGKRYTIYIGNYSKSTTTEIISHELIHMKQYYTGELRIIGNAVHYQDGIYKRARYMKYQYRPWERDAHREGRILYKKLKNN